MSVYQLVTWLGFVPQYNNARGRQPARLGAHAFEPGAPMSLCGYAPREKTTGDAAPEARRCVMCDRIIGGRALPRGAGSIKAVRP